jgi:antitoxin component of RelBE/YafQ-DinJ toxin-antitoxin module
MTFDKVRTNVYLDKSLKDQAKEFFKSYGLSLSDGLNFLLKKTLEKKELDLDMEIEPVLPGDPDYEPFTKGKKAF